MNEEEFTLFQQFMANIYLGGTDHLQFIINTISEDSFDYTQNDNQIMRELHCGRMDFYSTLKIYSILVEKRNYIMTPTDMKCLVNQYHF